MIYFTIYLIFNGKSISQWEHHILSIKRCEAIRPALNCFISMIISIDTLCGFAPLLSNVIDADHKNSCLFTNKGHFFNTFMGFNGCSSSIS